MNKILKAVCPNFPANKTVQPTRENPLWYSINGNKMFVPGEQTLRTNPIELSRYIEAIKAFEISDLDDPKYDWNNLELISITTLEQLKGLREKLNKGALACDIETMRVEWDDNRVLAIGFADSANRAYAIYNVDFEDGEVRDEIEKLFNSDFNYIWHNGKFDCGKLKYLLNVNAHVDNDTMLFHYVRINEKRGTHGLKDLARLYLNAPPWEDQLDLFKKTWCRENGIKLSEFTYDLIPIEVLVPYMQRDCIATYRLMEAFQPHGREGSEFIYNKLIEASNVYMEVELSGFRLDLVHVDELEVDLKEKVEEVEDSIKHIVDEYWNPAKYVAETGAKSIPKEFNIKSPKQLKWLLEQILGFSVPSTDKETVKSLIYGAKPQSVGRNILEKLDALRRYNKMTDTYVKGLRSAVCSDGRVRGTYNLHGTETGRLSSTAPNMQNIPREPKIRNMFVADEGYTLMQFDYSQAELRVLAMLSGDPWLRQVYVDGRDLHDAVSIQMFGEDFDSEQRNRAKTINFGIAYGRGPGSLAEAFAVPFNEAQKIIDDWFRPMPLVKQFIQQRRRMAARGDDCVTIFGRARHFVLTDSNFNHVQNEYINTPIQSIASDLTMFSLLTMYKNFKERNLDARIVATVHDSIIVEVRTDPGLFDLVAKIGTSVMETTPKVYIEDCSVPFKADVEYGKEWGSLEKWVM